MYYLAFVIFVFVAVKHWFLRPVSIKYLMNVSCITFVAAMHSCVGVAAAITSIASMMDPSNIAVDSHAVHHVRAVTCLPVDAHRCVFAVTCC